MKKLLLIVSSIACLTLLTACPPDGGGETEFEYSEPILEWGTARAVIREQAGAVSEFLESWQHPQTGNMYDIFAGDEAKGIIEYAYVFDSNNRLIEAFKTMDEDLGPDLVIWFNKNYVRVGETSGVVIYRDADKKSSISLEVTDYSEDLRCIQIRYIDFRIAPVVDAQ